MKDRILFIGLGNPLRGDDGIGYKLTEELTERGYNCRQHRDDFTLLLEDFKASDSVVIIDAMSDPTLELGDSRLMDAENLDEFTFNTSTHSLSLKQTFQMAKIMNCFPKALKVYAVNGENFELGDEMSSELNFSEHLNKLESLCTNQA